MQITVAKIIDNAIQKCGLITPSETPENIMRAKEGLMFVLLDMFNRGVPIFGVTPLIMGLEPEKYIYDMDPTIMDIFDLNWRQYHHIQTTPSGGTAPLNLQDYNWNTYATTSTNFTLTLTNPPIYFSYFGIVGFRTQTVSFVIEVAISAMLDTWQTIETYTNYVLEDGIWLWNDISTPVQGYAMRLRLTGGGTISLRGFFTGNRQAIYEQPAAKMNRDDFFYYPTKGINGIPINYYFQKTTTPQLQLWQGANGSNLFNWALSLYVFKTTDLELHLPLLLNVPEWYYEGIEWNLAAKIMYMLPNVDPGRMEMIKNESMRLMNEMEASNSDTSSLNLIGNITAPYQRRI